MNGSATVPVTDDVEELVRVREPGVAAVVLKPEPQPAWLIPLAESVETGRLQVRRTVLSDVTEADIRTWLQDGIEVDADLVGLRETLIGDLVELIALTRAVTGGERFVFRLFTEAPRRHCGYHVDTVVPGAPPWGLVRVYNGATTSYVDPAGVTSMTDFYRYFSRRERLVRLTEIEGDAAAQDEVVCLDEAPPFVHDPQAVRVVPDGAIVAFTHLDAQEMFAPSVRQPPWIHCSPMSGGVRLVVNISAVRGSRQPPRAAAAGSGRSANRAD